MPRRLFTIETQGAALLIWWGASVGNPLIDTFAINLRLFEPMASVAPEAFWGGLYLFCGLVSALCVYRDVRAWSALVNFSAFLSISVMFLLGDYRTYGWGVYALIAVTNFMRWRAFRWKATHS